MEEEDEEDVAYRRRQKEHVKGNKRVDVMEGESSLGKRKADEALEDEREHGRPRMRGSSSKITTAQPMLVHQPGGRMTTSKKAARPKWMTKAKQAAERRMTTTPTPALPSTPPHTPIPVPNPAQRRQGCQGCQRGAPQPLVTPQPVNACLTCIDFGVLCEPNLGYSCFTFQSRKKKCKQSGMARGQSALRARQPTQSRSVDARSQRGTPTRSRAPSEAPAPRSQCSSCAASTKRGTSVNTQPPTNPQDRPNMASSSMGIILHILPSRAARATMIRMESAPQTSVVKAPVNMRLIPGTTYSLGRNPLVSHEEHHAALQQLETVEGENHELCELITRALDCIEVLEQGMASLGRVCKATRRSIATSPTDFNRADMGFPFEQEGSTVASDHNLHPDKPSHSPSPSLPSNTITIPSTINLDRCWHIRPAII
ncbi:hypothetical protein BDN67DRAFT_1015765 [Paxillus ammoniavirescens]|nr:hypothetical protein BDN67DRAFT_1015765 [Paxillus ammoniavirescens]